MKKTIILIISIVCIFILCSCSNAASEEQASSDGISKSESENQNSTPDVSPPAVKEETTSSAVSGVIPTSLVFAADGNGGYYEPVLGEWDVFLSDVFKNFESGEVDPGSGNIKYYGEGNDGYGYCFIVTTRSDSSGILSYNIDTAIISIDPNSGGDEVSGQDMVRWMYDNFHK